MRTGNQPKKKSKFIKIFSWIVFGVATFYLHVMLLVYLMPTFLGAVSGSDCFSGVRYVQVDSVQGEVFCWDFTGKENKILTVKEGVVTESVGEPPETYYETHKNVVVQDSSFKCRRYEHEAPGYEGVIALLTSRYVKKSIQAYNIYAIEHDKENQIAYGFFNLYSRTVGCLSGGGNSNTKKIVAGVYFSYAANTKELHVIQEVEKGCMVACGKDGCVYMRNRKFYVKPLNAPEKFLCDNIAHNAESGDVDVHFSQNAFSLQVSYNKELFKKARKISILASYDGTVYVKDVNTEYPQYW